MGCLLSPPVFMIIIAWRLLLTKIYIGNLGENGVGDSLLVIYKVWKGDSGVEGKNEE